MVSLCQDRALQEGQQDCVDLSPIFSIRIVVPPAIADRSPGINSVCPSLCTCKRPDSRALTQATPWSCGSIISGQRVEAVTIAPFSEETGSRGSPWEFQPATSASVAIKVTTVVVASSWRMGTELPATATCRYGMYDSRRSSSRNFLLNGPPKVY